MVPDRRYWEPTYRYMNSINQKIWEWYPKNYRQLDEEERKVAKEKVKQNHPEVGGLWKEYFTLKGELERCSQNYPIQSLAGSQTKKSMILFRRQQIEQGLRDKVWLTNLIHDEALAEVVDGYEQQGKELLEQCMIQGANEYCKRVKMVAEGVICQWWYH